ncbi:MAG: RNA polymerase sigma factor, partial [Actinomycetia bacterium]|nr:RNA polymerase sigma factor [Actinomycetes bacterium]
MSDPTLEDVWRREAPQVLGALVRKYGDFDGCEDACQEALAAAVQEWPLTGQPRNPRAWLIRVASRRLVDAWRSDGSRVERERVVGVRNPADALTEPGADDADATATDDTLRLLMLCCHRALTKASQVALTLRAVGGLSTEQIATAFLVPPATMAQRI